MDPRRKVNVHTQHKACLAPYKAYIRTIKIGWCLSVYTRPLVTMAQSKIWMFSRTELLFLPRKQFALFCLFQERNYFHVLLWEKEGRSFQIPSQNNVNVTVKHLCFAFKTAKEDVFYQLFFNVATNFPVGSN